MFWGEKPYHSLDYEMKQRFGEKVYRLSLNGGMTCPNRDGTVGTGGCIFCSAGGSGDFAAPAVLPISEQLRMQKELIAKKRPVHKYIAYFQAYTNTYAPVEYLERIFLEAISDPEVVALSIATRPDCLPEDILRMLSRLREKKPIFVELGLQTMHDETARYIRRGYRLPVFDAAVDRLHTLDVEVVAHMILGLPGETPEMIVQTARHLGQVGVDGVKLHLLHVLRGTDLALAYKKGLVPVLQMDEYITLLERCLAVLPPSVVIHRLTGDGAKRDLIAPLWSADKKRVLNEIRRRFDLDGVVQGSSWKP